MLPKVVKAKRKQLSRGQRRHVRRMKQEARKGSLPDNKLKKPVRMPEAPRE